MRRTIAFDATACVTLLVDEVRQHSSTAPIATRALFHAAAGATITIEGDEALITPPDGPGRLLVRSLLPGATASVIRGGRDPLQGYVVDEDRLVEAAVLSLAQRAVRPRWMTLLVPYAIEAPEIRVVRVVGGTDWLVELVIDGRTLRFDAPATDCGVRLTP